jgi:uncharacterized protein (TIGR02284 family)
MGLRKQEATPMILSNLLETCRESEAGLRRAVVRSKKHGLKEFFGAEALQQALFAAELELELKKLGIPMKHLTRPRAKLRGWKEIRGTRLLPAGDETVLFLCEWGERAALGEYITALRSDLPANVLELVERQCSQLREAYTRLDQIREQLRSDGQEPRVQSQDWSEPGEGARASARHRAR